MARAIVVCAVTAALALHTLAGAALSGAMRVRPQPRLSPVAVQVVQAHQTWSLNHGAVDRRPISKSQDLAAPLKEDLVAATSSTIAQDASLGSPQDVYLPRSVLTKSPIPAAPVFIDIPSGFPTGERYRSVVNLFIDETGLVRKVEFSEPPLPDAIQTSVRSAFMQTQFQPGEVKGVRVKSLLRFEVTFDDGTQSQPDSATGNASNEPSELSKASG